MRDQLTFNLLMSAKIVLGATGSTPTQADLKRLHDAVVAFEDAQMQNPEGANFGAGKTMMLTRQLNREVLR
ncbi:MAG: hypothetical protein Q8P42_06065 [Gallionella sp.]|nr:hypothetical protein [Gallionella sp.]